MNRSRVRLTNRELVRYLVVAVVVGLPVMGATGSSTIDILAAVIVNFAINLLKSRSDS